jgi:cell division protein FtsB
MSDADRPLRLLAILLLALLAWLQYRLWFGEGGAIAATELQAKVDRQAEENRGLGQRNGQLAAEVDNLKSGEAAVEERARSELGMIKPGETFYRVIEAPPPPAEAPPPAVDQSP